MHPNYSQCFLFDDPHAVIEAITSPGVGDCLIALGYTSAYLSLDQAERLYALLGAWLTDLDMVIVETVPQPEIMADGTPPPF